MFRQVFFSTSLKATLNLGVSIATTSAGGANKAWSQSHVEVYAAAWEQLNHMREVCAQQRGIGCTISRGLLDCHRITSCLAALTVAYHCQKNSRAASSPSEFVYRHARKRRTHTRTHTCRVVYVMCHNMACRACVCRSCVRCFAGREGAERSDGPERRTKRVFCKSDQRKNDCAPWTVSSTVWLNVWLLSPCCLGCAAQNAEECEAFCEM